MTAWTMFPFVLVRKACFAQGELNVYRHHRALELHDQARQFGDRMFGLRDEIIKGLQACVPHIAERELRRTVLSAQRALFHGRPLPAGDWLRQLAPDSGLAAAIEKYNTFEIERVHMTAARDAAFEAEAMEKTGKLLSLLRTTSFQLGLLMVNRRLCQQLSTIDIDDRLDKRRRQTLVRAMRYLLRATFKPVPLSFLAATAIAELGESAQTPPSDYKSSVIPNRQVFRSVAATLLAHPAVRGAAIVFVAPTFFSEHGQSWVLDPADDRLYRKIEVDPELAERLLAAPRQGFPYEAFAESTTLTPTEIDTLIDQGIIVVRFDTSESEVDDGEALSRALWQAVPADISVLTVIARIAEFQKAIGDLGTFEPAARAKALCASETAVRLLPGIDANAKLPILAHEDTVTFNIAPIHANEWQGFFEELARFGAAPIDPTPLPQEQALAHLYPLLCPGESHEPLLSFHRRYLDFCAKNGFGTDPDINGPLVCRALGQPYRDHAAATVADLKAAIASAKDHEVIFNPPARFEQRPTTGSGRRISIRFAPARAGPSGPRFQLLFWGSDRMSLFPRYANLPHPNAKRLCLEFAAWMARWPDVADVYSSFGSNIDLRPALTQRLIDGPDLPPRAGGIALHDLYVTIEPSEGRLVLLDASGRRVRPLFFGVSAPYRLPSIVRFLMFFSSAQMSPLELTLVALNRIYMEAMTAPLSSPVRFPAVYLGAHTLVSPPAVVFDPRRLPTTGPTVDRRGFFTIQDWLAENNLPRLAQVRLTRGEPMWVDFHHPTGVDSFLRFIGKADVAMIQPLEMDAGIIQVQDQEHKTEYYAELSTH
jgi:Lantibiotic dehydratase, N terminus